MDIILSLLLGLLAAAGLGQWYEKRKENNRFGGYVIPNSTGATNLSTISGSSITLGQKTSANSLPVVLPSDASANKGSASSGDNMYMSPADFTATYASGTTLTLTALPFTPTNAQFVSVKVQPASGLAVIYGSDSNAFSFNSTTGVLTVTGATFTNTDTYVVTLTGPKKQPFDTASSAYKTSLIRDVSDQYVPTVLQPSAALAAATYYYYLYMDGFSHAAFNVDIGANTTVTYEMTFDDPSGSPTYYDRTVTGYWANATAQGIGATSFTATHSMWFDDVNCRAVRVKVVVASGTPTTYITAKQVY